MNHHTTLGKTAKGEDKGSKGEDERAPGEGAVPALFSSSIPNMALPTTARQKAMLHREPCVQLSVLFLLA